MYKQYGGYEKTVNNKVYYSRIQINKQAQTVDQNYANNILFMALSTLESIEQRLKDGKRAPVREQKEFGRYDKHDYSYKELAELKAQLRNNVMLLAYSKRAFEKTYGSGSYVLPSNYDLLRVVARLK